MAQFSLLECIQDHDSGYWNINNDGEENLSSSNLIVQDGTPDTGKYTAMLVDWDQNYNALSYAVNFTVTTQNTLKVNIISTTSVASWTAPARHSSGDQVCAVTVIPNDLICNGSLADSSCLDCSSVDSGSLGTQIFSTGVYSNYSYFFIYIVNGDIDQVSATTGLYKPTAPKGVCDSHCFNKGAVCTIPDDCLSCTGSGDCVFPETPYLISPQSGTDSDSIIFISGDKLVSLPMVVANRTSCSYKFYVTETFANSNITVDSKNGCKAMFYWVPDLTSSGSYSFEFQAVDQTSGVVSYSLTWEVDIREDACSFWGDPHFIQIDGGRYDFQGYGEYWGLKLTNSADLPIQYQSLAIQTRFLPCGGTFSAGGVTCISGFAVGWSDFKLEVFQTNLSRGTSSTPYWATYINGNSTDIYKPSSVVLKNTKGVQVGSISPVDSDKIRYLFDFRGYLGFSVTASLDTIADFYLALNSVFQGRMRGLCGNFDGIDTNDLISRNGTVIPQNSTSHDIYYGFGDTWRVTQQESLFNYTHSAPYGFGSYDSVNVVYDPLWSPIWATTEDQVNGERMCGNLPTGNDYDTCVFDVSVGGTELAFSAARNQLSACLQKQSADDCAFITACNNFCNLNGKCEYSDENASYSCVCSPGYSGSDCATYVQSEASLSSDSNPSVHYQVQIELEMTNIPIATLEAELGDLLSGFFKVLSLKEQATAKRAVVDATVVLLAVDETSKVELETVVAKNPEKLAQYALLSKLNTNYGVVVVRSPNGNNSAGSAGLNFVAIFISLLLLFFH